MNVRFQQRFFCLQRSTLFVLFLILSWFVYVSRLANYCMHSRLELEEMFNDISSEPIHQNINTEIEFNPTSKIRILCWVMTQPQYHHERALHVKNTWGKRCDKLLFMSTINDPMLPSIDLQVKEGYDKIWGKTKKAFEYIYDNYLEDYDWFMKADDDTFVILENLRYFLSNYDTDEDSVYFGHKYTLSKKLANMSGGGGYVLSRKSLKLFIEKSLPNATLCRQENYGHEDQEIGKCLANVGVLAGDTRDTKERGTFFHFSPAAQFMPQFHIPMWHWEISYYLANDAEDCCSDLAISFHKIEPARMYELEYLIYRLHPYRIQYSDRFPAPLPPDKESLPKRVVEMMEKNYKPSVS